MVPPCFIDTLRYRPYYGRVLYCSRRHAEQDPVTLSTSAVTVAGFRHSLLIHGLNVFSACSSGDVFRISLPAPLTARELSVGIHYSYSFSVIAFDRIFICISCVLSLQTAFLSLYSLIIRIVNEFFKLHFCPDLSAWLLCLRAPAGSTSPAIRL